MISILIPVYNYDITGLVTELHRQCMDLDMPFEIICYDDGSQSEYKVQNQTIGQIEFVKYKEIEKNHFWTCFLLFKNLIYKFLKRSESINLNIY